MCTVILATRVWSELPLLVATNRDERLDRPSQPPSRWLEGGVAPRDERAGGTWIGCSDAGVIAAVTNRFGSARDPGRRSRGELVPLALTEPSAQEAARRITTEVADHYNPFHLVVADRVSAWLILAVEGRLMASPLPRGVHVVTERSFRDEPSDRELALEGAVEGWSTPVPPSDAVVEGVLRRHREPAFDGVCVHMPDLGYGTRSSSVLRLPAVGDASWRFADGPPCTATFRSVQMR